MKCNNKHQRTLIFFVMTSLCLTLTSSCSFLSKRGSVFGGSTDKEASELEKVNYVSKKEYNDLKQKYDQLLKSQSNEINLTESSSNDQKSDIISDLSQVAENELAETVDMFGNSSLAKSNKNIVISGVAKDYDADLVNKHTQILDEARSLAGQNKINEAMTSLKLIESSPIGQIRVRARFTLGEILLAQKQYDLAMQVFEQIITENAFSGIVLSALGRLIVCSDKLKLNKKKEKYYSILHDFFGAT